MLTRGCFVGAIVLLVACGKRSEPFDAGLVTNLDASVPDGGVARFQGLRLDQMLAVTEIRGNLERRSGAGDALC
jgi:hypothetical protein